MLFPSQLLKKLEPLDGVGRSDFPPIFGSQLEDGVALGGPMDPVSAYLHHATWER